MLIKIALVLAIRFYIFMHAGILNYFKIWLKFIYTTILTFEFVDINGWVKLLLQF